VTFFHFVRFIRWQYMLRRVGVRLPIRPSLSIYLAGLAGTATPAYVGELIRNVIIRRRFSVPLQATVPVLISERLLDVAALALVLLIAGDTWPWRRSGLLVLGLAVLAGLLLTGAALPWKTPGTTFRTLFRPGILFPCLVLSLGAWMPAALLLSIAAGGLGRVLPVFQGARAFAGSTLLGGLTLMPAGLGVTGSAAILQIHGVGLALADAVVIVSIVRLTTTGLSLAAGSAALIRELRSREHADPGAAAEHFHDIASAYQAQFSAHVWDHLIQRKTDIIEAALGPQRPEERLGLDLGCGLGQQCRALAARGHRLVGVDAALGLLRQARAHEVSVAAADALRLPFRDGTFDFVYTIGVLHHLRDADAQSAAAREVARVLKPGGKFIVHETNPHNPLFRFYMGYIFPMVRTIDEGTECWIPPGFWSRLPGWTSSDIRYFTFLPDFIPRALMRPALQVERLLERSALGRFSVHYVAVQRRSVPETRPDGVTRAAGT